MSGEELPESRQSPPGREETGGTAGGSSAHATRPLVSIVISNFNGAGYVRRCLTALQQLNYPAVEIIVIDAGSTDESVTILQKEFPTVKVVQVKGVGIGTAINIGIRLSRGNFLLLDYNIDEMAAPPFLDRLVNALQ